MDNRTQFLLKSAIAENAANLVDFIQAYPDLVLVALNKAKDDYNNSYNFLKHRGSELIPIIEALQKYLEMETGDEKNMALSQIMKNLAQVLSKGTWKSKSINTLVITELTVAWNGVIKQFSPQDNLSIDEIEHQGKLVKDGLFDRAYKIHECKGRLEDKKKAESARAITKVSNTVIEQFLAEQVEKKQKEEEEKKQLTPIAQFSPERKKFNSNLLGDVLSNRMPPKKSYTPPEIHKLTDVKKDACSAIEGLMMGRLAKKEEEKDKKILQHIAIEKPTPKKISKEQIGRSFSEIEKTLALNLVKQLPAINNARLEDTKRKAEQFHQEGYLARIKEYGYAENKLKLNYLDELDRKEELKRQAELEIDKQLAKEAAEELALEAEFELVPLPLLSVAEVALESEFVDCMDVDEEPLVMEVPPVPANSPKIAKAFAERRIDPKVFAQSLHETALRKFDADISTRSAFVKVGA